MKQSNNHLENVEMCLHHHGAHETHPGQENLRIYPTKVGSSKSVLNFKVREMNALLNGGKDFTGTEGTTPALCRVHTGMFMPMHVGSQWFSWFPLLLFCGLLLFRESDFQKQGVSWASTNRPMEHHNHPKSTDPLADHSVSLGKKSHRAWWVGLGCFCLFCLVWFSW